MRLIHKVAFTPEEIESFRQLVFNNLMHGMRLVFEALHLFQIGIDEANLVGPVSIPFLCDSQ
jgi:guanine nucleotide-binding protein subunit alpha